MSPNPISVWVRGDERDFAARHPGGNDIGLLVEIADTSLAADRAMARTCSAAGIAVYWIVNLRQRQIEVHTGPSADGYTSLQIYKASDEVPLVLDGTEVGRIAVSDVLP